LPVTKSVVKDSGMGKAIGSIGKSKICAGTPNEEPIKERVTSIKDAWNRSVKARKEKAPPQEKRSSDSSVPVKRELDTSSQVSAPISKKPKVEETRKSSSLSSLMQKMAPAKDNGKPGVSSKTSEASKKAAAQKKQKKRVKWEDHFGGNLTTSKILEDADAADAAEHTDDPSVSWSDRRKRDRLREKELLATAKYVNLTDDDDDMGMGADIPTQRRATAQPTIAWHVPALLPENADTPPPQVNSQEKIAQTARMVTVTAAKYSSEYSVPSNPMPMSDVEQALDMASQSSAVTQNIPFFVPQAPAPAPIAAIPPAPQFNATSSASSYPGAPTPPANGVASTEMVQSLGLPVFLAGQDMKALQTLASTPSLLNTFVDSNGMYDQVRLTSLVQTLSGSAPAPGQNPPTPASYPAAGFGTASSGTYGAGGGGGIYGPASGPGSFGSGMKPTGYRGAQNSDGNLHLSGYGPMTTQSEIIALFSPYVQVTEVVMKQNFCFVNSNDPNGAQLAREALNGALLGGQPVRINSAQRKNRDAVPGADPFNKGPSAGGSYYGQQSSGIGVSNPGFSQPPAPPPPMGQMPGQTPGAAAGGDFSNVRDDRGNPATKNLFVAGYGQGTSETLLRQVFSPHCEIVGVIQKGTFSFINTADRIQAIHAREALAGTLLNGGVLRINFAKESGRLGTSFDLTYGNKPGQPQQPPRSHYGPRGF
ncbi:MAG: hypothetical protein SGILL_004301, partial [Bacillariaceae sp.]